MLWVLREDSQMTMTAQNPKTNRAAKSALARLMAAEDIAVEVDAQHTGATEARIEHEVG